MRISYNSPVVLTFAILSLLELLVQEFINPGVKQLFVVSSFEFSSFLSYFQLTSHIFGHANWEHYIANFSFILLLGPLIEEKYGSFKVILLIFFTSLITGALFLIAFDGGLLGASGVVFMFIILSSFTRYQGRKIPLTFILVAAIFLGKEVYNSFADNHISEFAHILGGICGAVFGFYLTPPITDQSEMEKGNQLDLIKKRKAVILQDKNNSEENNDGR